jgi:hypothetical protein
MSSELATGCASRTGAVFKSFGLGRSLLRGLVGGASAAFTALRSVYKLYNVRHGGEF